MYISTESNLYPNFSTSLLLFWFIFYRPKRLSFKFLTILKPSSFILAMKFSKICTNIFKYFQLFKNSLVSFTLIEKLWSLIDNIHQIKICVACRLNIDWKKFLAIAKCLSNLSTRALYFHMNAEYFSIHKIIT